MKKEQGGGRHKERIIKARPLAYCVSFVYSSPCEVNFKIIDMVKVILKLKNDMVKKSKTGSWEKSRIDLLSVFSFSPSTPSVLQCFQIRACRTVNGKKM